MKFEITKESELELLDTMYGFSLGSLESQMLQQMGIHYNINTDKFFAIWDDIAKTPEACFKFMLKNRNDSNKISDYLCLINWLSYIYAQMLNPNFKKTLNTFQLDFEEMIDYIDYCGQWYRFTYNYLMDELENETRIPDRIKEQIYVKLD